MHRLASQPGGWVPGTEGVIVVEQRPAPVVWLTAADTDIQTLAQVLPLLPPDFPALRCTNLLQLRQQLTIDTYGEEVLAQARLIVVRLLGGRAYWSYGLEVLRETVERSGAAVVVVPGDDRPDPELMSHSTLSFAVTHQIWRYLSEGGVENLRQALLLLGNEVFGRREWVEPPRVIPGVGRYCWCRSVGAGACEIACDGFGFAEGSYPQPLSLPREEEGGGLARPVVKPAVAILFYRAHFLSGNTRFVDAFAEALLAQGLVPLPLYVASLRDPGVQAGVVEWCRRFGVAAIANTTGFATASELWERLDLPVLQTICSGGSQEAWQGQGQGLSPSDIAMNVALPEVDGRIITRVISFKAMRQRHEGLDTAVLEYAPAGDRLAFVAQLLANWVRLRQTPPPQRRIALILANYPNRDGRLANGVGLDTPASCLEILQALQQAGYNVTDRPASVPELIQALTAGVTQDPEGRSLRPVVQSLSRQDYLRYFQTLPEAVRQGVCDRWGCPYLYPESPSVGDEPRLGPTNVTSDFRLPTSDFRLPTSDFRLPTSDFPSPGIQLGHVFLGIQPSRGYDRDPSLSYHAPDLAPTHDYLAFYHWIREHFGAQAVIHVGKHGNLEWLPGKSLALSQVCYPEVALGPMPHLYPFIVNDPGEGSQAKRRSQAVIVDHLTPPLTRAELYGPLLALERLVDEYYEAQQLDPQRLPVLLEQLVDLFKTTRILRDLGLETGLETGGTQGWARGSTTGLDRLEQEILAPIDTYLCELKEAQIRDGLHILGRCPEGTLLRDLILAIARSPATGRLGLTQAIAQDWQLDWDPLVAEFSEPLPPGFPLEQRGGLPLRRVGEAIACLEEYAARLVEAQLGLGCDETRGPVPPLLGERGLGGEGKPGPATTQVLAWIRSTLLPALQQTHQEITHLLQGLDGRYVPSGPSGAPTRGRADVLPTGRNFYSVDVRGLPTETAWAIGQRAAEAVIERYTQEHGDYPQSLGLSLWGTATMRTGGDDLAQALALLGTRPVWDGPSRRVVDFEVLPISLLGRPRVDVTLRISGFFRDAFPHLIDLFDRAIAVVADLDEPADQNPLAARVRQESAQWQTQGVGQEEAQRRSRYRIFGSPPGTYGAGLGGLLESQNWQTEADFAEAYLNWSSVAYTASAQNQTQNQTQNQIQSQAAPDALRQRLSQLQIILQNQDNREHDLLDSDDYYQFQGGMAAAVKTLGGAQPSLYFGDHATPSRLRIRSLSEEIARVYRSRVINPKWIAGALRHGYKGTCEMAATVDFLMAYDATTGCVEDAMYQGIAEAYLLEPTVRQTIQDHNPWAVRDIAERLLEAAQRQLWSGADPAVLHQLRSLSLEAEAQLESTQLRPPEHPPSRPLQT